LTQFSWVNLGELGLYQGSNLATEKSKLFFVLFYAYFLYIFSPTIFFLLCKYFFYFSIHNSINFSPFFCTQFHKFYFFFLDLMEPHIPRKAHFVSPGEGVKPPRLLQKIHTLTRTQDLLCRS